MKKWVAASVLTTALLVGCTDESTVAPPEQEKVEKPIVQQTETKVYSGLKMDLDAALNVNVLDVNVSLENTSDNTIPFYLKDKQVLKILVQDEKGNVVAEEVIKEEKRTKISQKEEVIWSKKITLKEKSLSFKVTAELLFMDKENETYKKEELKTSKELKGNKKDLLYLPDEKKEYIYDELLNSGEEKEVFTYFQDGYVQSTSTLEGTKVYVQDDSGLHVVYANDFNEINENIISKIEADKKTMIKFPIQVGNIWRVDDDVFEITQTDAKIETPYADFENVVVIETSSGGKFYYDETVGLIQIDLDGKPALRLQDIR